MGFFKELNMELDAAVLAIEPKSFWTMMAMLSAGLAEPDYERLGLDYRARRQRATATTGKIAVLPLYGFISHRADVFTLAFGGTSTEDFGQALDVAMADTTVTRIVIDVDSPGGTTDGVAELAAKIQAARATKQIVAVANTWMASAAYWLGASATEVVASPSSHVGSIGVFAIHEDLSVALETAGVKPTVISSSDYKSEGNPFEPLGDEARDEIQKQVDQLGRMFERDVAQGRGVSLATVQAKFGQGRVYGAVEAKERGMVDRVGTLEQTLARLSGGASRGRTRAEADLTLVAMEV
jgi:signal peptide peptidase SppA